MDTKPAAPESSKKEDVEVKSEDVKTVPAATAATEDVPDPDEDDLDDLDGEMSSLGFYCVFQRTLTLIPQTCLMNFQL